MKKFLLLTALLGCFTMLKANGLEEMHGLDLQYIKVPFYKDQKIQLLVFADSANRKEHLLVAGNTFLDMLLENANVDKIPDGWRIRPLTNGQLPENFQELHQLNAPFGKVLEFWKKRYNISDAVIFTSQSFIDQGKELVYGDNQVFFRSPLFDLDGVGFSVKYKNQVISINENVRIILRSSDMDPRKIHTGSPMPKKQRFVAATANELHIYRKENKIVLNGNVEVIDGNNRIRCNRLRIFLNEKTLKDDNLRTTSSDHNNAALDYISRILADGDVQLYRYPDAGSMNNNSGNAAIELGKAFGNTSDSAAKVQKSTADHLEYDVKREIIILTSDNKARPPALHYGLDVRLEGERIELLRNENKVFVLRDCRIVARSWDPEKKCFFTRWINSDRANFNGETNVANFHGNVIAVDRNNTLTTDSLRIHLNRKTSKSGAEIELLFANGNVKIVSRSEKDSTNAAGKKTISHSKIESSWAELNYKTNKLVFGKNVKVRDASATLDCDRLDLFLADKPERPKQNSKDPSGAPLAAGLEGQDKTLTKMIAKGDVKMTSKGDFLGTDILTLYFRDLPPGEKPVPGMIQSGGVQLTKIQCDGAVIARSMVKGKGSSSYTRKMEATNAISDLLKDYSEFHGNVKMSDGDTEIECQDMYIFTGASPIRENINEKPVAQAPRKAPEDDLDADPFAIEASENAVPGKVIAISDNRNLKRVVCQRQVVLLRRDKKGDIHRAGGDRAVYTVNTQEVMLTATAPNRPWLRSNGRKHFCDVIRSDVKTGDLRGIGNVIVLPDNEK